MCFMLDFLFSSSYTYYITTMSIHTQAQYEFERDNPTSACENAVVIT